MPRGDLARDLAALEDALTHRVELWRVIVDEHGDELGRAFLRSIYRPPGSFIEPSQKERHHE